MHFSTKILASGRTGTTAYCHSCGQAVEFPVNNDKGKVIHGDAVRRLRGMGWAIIKGRVICNGCQMMMRDNPSNPDTKEEIVSTITETPKPRDGSVKLGDLFPKDVREPTPQQKRQVFELLSEVYDADKRHYLGGETDKTVAETIGCGVMPGWVSKIREEFFGPDGSNEDIAKLRKDLDDLLKSADALAQLITSKVTELAGIRGTVKSLSDRLETVCKAIGPKAGK